MLNRCVSSRWLRLGSSLTLLIATLGLATPVGSADASPRLFGLYSRVEANPQNINVILGVDAWLGPTGKRATVGGLFATVEANFNEPPLTGLWNNGYVPYISLTSQRTSSQIANGDVDVQIRNWAHRFALWAAAGPRRAFIALLPEMNGNWKAYFGPPAQFKQAFARIRQIVEEELQGQGASLESVSWVFAPNGWSQPGNEFENYYPGPNAVDAVSINSYNYGGCPGAAGVWEWFDAALKPYLDRLRVMAPGKPLFIGETGTVEKAANGVGDKDQWLFESFTALASYPHFRLIVYFNLNEIRDTLPACPGPAGADFRLHVPGTSQWMGFWNAMNTLPNFVYWAPNSPQMIDIAFNRGPAQIFADVPTIHPFALEDGEVDFAPWVQALFDAGITGGCVQSPLSFCPNDGVTRGQMAVFLLRGMFGRNFVPPPPGGLFDDVPQNHSFAAWIETLADEGITQGCGGNNYCPAGPVTRAQMAVFLLRAMHGASYVPPAGTGVRFADVPSTHPFVDWIEQLASEGITSGCGGGNFCPNEVVTRAQMAVFLVRAFNLAP
jgi:hypothetical protein